MGGGIEPRPGGRPPVQQTSDGTPPDSTGTPTKRTRSEQLPPIIPPGPKVPDAQSRPAADPGAARRGGDESEAPAKAADAASAPPSSDPPLAGRDPMTGAEPTPAAAEAEAGEEQPRPARTPRGTLPEGRSLFARLGPRNAAAASAPPSSDAALAGSDPTTAAEAAEQPPRPARTPHGRLPEGRPLFARLGPNNAAAASAPPSSDAALAGGDSTTAGRATATEAAEEPPRPARTPHGRLPEGRPLFARLGPKNAEDASPPVVATTPAAPGATPAAATGAAPAAPTDPAAAAAATPADPAAAAAAPAAPASAAPAVGTPGAAPSGAAPHAAAAHGHGPGGHAQPASGHPAHLGAAAVGHSVPATAGHGGAAGHAPAHAASAPGTPGAADWHLDAGPPEHPSPEAAAAVEHQVHASAHAERAKLSALLAQRCADVDAHVAAKHQQLTTAAQHHTAAIHAHAQAARGRLAAEVTQAQARLKADAQAKRHSIDAWHTAATAHLTDGVRARQDRTRKLGETHATSLTTAASSAAQRAQTQVAGKAQDARNIGQSKAGATGPTPDATSAKRKAANDIANDSASKITGGLGTTVADIHKTGQDAGTKLKGDASDAATQIGSSAPQVVAHLGTQKSQALAEIDHTEAHAVAAIAQAHTQLQHQIATAEHQHLQHVQTAHHTHASQLTHAGHHAVTTLRAQGDKALAAGDHSVAQITAKARHLSIGHRQAKQIGDHLVTQVRHGFGSLHHSVEAGAHQVRGSLDHAATGATQSFAPIDHASATSFADLTTHAHTTLQHQTTQVSTQLGHVATQVQTTGDHDVATFLQGLDQQIDTVDHKLATSAADVQGKIDAQATSATQKAGEPVGTVAPRIDEAHARIDAKAKQSQKGWLARQLDTLVSMLSDPGFWAALVVGLVLAVVVIALLPAELTVGAVLLGLAAMAVVGALAAGVGTVVSNLAAGRPWNQNLGTNMLIGAVFGAVLFGASLLLPEGIVGYLGLAGIAGVLTVITNLATGRPWDEGLLANMALVGVLAWLGKFFPKGAKGGPVEDPVKPPGPIDDPVNPGPGVDPNKPAPGVDPNKPGPGVDPNKPGPAPDPNKPVEPNPEPAKPTGLPPDLATAWDSLSSRAAKDQFNAKYDQITKGAANPTPRQLDAFRGYLKSRGNPGPDLDGNLAADWEKAHPAPKEPRPPHGDAVQELPGIRSTLDQTRAELQALKASRPNLKGVDRLLKSLSSEERILTRMETGDLAADMDASGRANVRGLKNNVDGIRAELLDAQSDPNATELAPEFDLNGKKIEIDRITNNGETWVDVKNYAPFDKGSSNMPKLVDQARQALELAEAHPVGSPPHPPELVWQFPRGVTRSVKGTLEAIDVNGRHVRITGKIVDPVDPPVPVPPPPRKQDPQDEAT